MHIYGYISVPAEEMETTLEYKTAIQQAGVPLRNIYVDEQSGPGQNSRCYEKLVKKVQPGDSLVVQSLDCLGHTVDELIAQWYILTKVKKMSVIVLDMPALNAQTYLNQNGDVIADVVLQVLTFAAHGNRAYARRRQKEGIQRAQQNGVKFGRKGKEHPAEFESLKEQYLQREVTVRYAANQLGISRATFTTWVKQSEDSHDTI